MSDCDWLPGVDLGLGALLPFLVDFWGGVVWWEGVLSEEEDDDSVSDSEDELLESGDESSGGVRFCLGGDLWVEDFDFLEETDAITGVLVVCWDVTFGGTVGGEA